MKLTRTSTAPAGCGNSRGYRKLLRTGLMSLRLRALSLLLMLALALARRFPELTAVHLNLEFVPPALLPELGSFICFRG